VQAGQTIQSGAKGAAESINKFVEGQDEKAGSAASRGTGAAPERQDFWDSFGAAEVTAEHGQPSTLGTNAMKGGAAGKGKEDGWGDDW
jgi:ADP-ribosylation factor GTPase-activating protein 1